MSIKSRIAIISCTLLLVVSVIITGLSVSVYAATIDKFVGGTVIYTAPAPAPPA